MVSISIHAPHAGSDLTSWAIWLRPINFNPRSPCGERRGDIQTASTALIFQSTLPMRGATAAPSPDTSTAPEFQSTLPMRGATASLVNGAPDQLFQSTLPMRGATEDSLSIRRSQSISIHAPHAGSDARSPTRPLLKRISIHAPHAGSD